ELRLLPGFSLDLNPDQRLIGTAQPDSRILPAASASHESIAKPAPYGWIAHLEGLRPACACCDSYPPRGGVRVRGCVSAARGPRVGGRSTTEPCVGCPHGR